ncbi:MAG: hypothetical protein Q8K86_11525 [Candidatus Nanopelagicaceae bacterium]|nr:hypothetical protein [Candidatus Nanopelagicaceae bacterium]
MFPVEAYPDFRSRLMDRLERADEEDTKKILSFVKERIRGCTFGTHHYPVAKDKAVLRWLMDGPKTDWRRSINWPWIVWKQTVEDVLRHVDDSVGGKIVNKLKEQQ